MGKAAKGSRKGKKAWRANISAADIDDYFDKVTKDALSGTSASIASAPAEALFYVDKSADVPVKRKIEKKRERVLNHEKILQRNAFIQPVPSSTLKKSFKRKSKVRRDAMETEPVSKGRDDSASVEMDLWEINGFSGEVRQNVKKASASHIPAVEIEPEGCSFNPPFESHQDTLAQAVAIEMQKIYKKELEPTPVPLTVPGEAIDEEEMFFLEVDEETGVEHNEHVGSDNELTTKRNSKTKRVTRVEFNKRARRKEQLRAEEEAKKVENVHKEIDCIEEIVNEISKEDEERSRRHLRRDIAKKERHMAGPPRLGKHKFEPAPIQVLLNEEISGSLRKLKACCTLTTDRYKSLEKRGLIVPKARKR